MANEQDDTVRKVDEPATSAHDNNNSSNQGGSTPSGLVCDPNVDSESNEVCTPNDATNSSITDEEDDDGRDDDDDADENEEEDGDGNSISNGNSDWDRGGGKSGPLLADQVRVLWIDETKSTENIHDVTVVDCGFLHGDFVASASDPTGQVGVVCWEI
nr:putative ubiquitin-conjugating enzyme e2 23 [Quercus suber]